MVNPVIRAHIGICNFLLFSGLAAGKGKGMAQEPEQAELFEILSIIPTKYNA